MTAGPASARQDGAPRVSVVIATYDRPLNLSMAIESVLRQSDQNWEIVVIGDHCNPETAEVLAGFGEARLRYVNLPGRCGECNFPEYRPEAVRSCSPMKPPQSSWRRRRL